MAGNGGKKKKKKTKKTKADATPRRSSLTPEQKQKVAGMHEILGEVWEPFKTADGAIRGLEKDPAPSLELEFWDSLAEAFLRYYGKAITLKVDTEGLARDQRAAAEASAAAQSLIVAEVSTTADGITGDDKTHEGDGGGGGGGGGNAYRHASSENSSRREQVGGRGGGEGKGVEEEEGLSGGGERLEMLPMGVVGHLGREDRLRIIRKTVPMEKRVVVLQRLFYLAQAPADNIERLVGSVKELGNHASPSDIRDVNLLETWQGVREERSAAWDAATEQVRLAAANAANAAAQAPPETDGASLPADPPTIVGGADSPAGS